MISRRRFAPYDRARLEKHLSALGYRIVVRKNQTAAQIKNIFESIRKNSPEYPELHIKKEDDSFICVMSSRGKWDETRNTDVVLGSDAKPIYLEQMVYSTLGATACELLKGKPKLFFIEASRGDKYEPVAGDSDEEAIPAQLPQNSDFLFSYSTTPMHKSYRYDPPSERQVSELKDYEFGGFFTRELCLAFDCFGDKIDLMSMLLYVHQQLQARERNVFQIRSNTTRQCPQITLSMREPCTMLTKGNKTPHGLAVIISNEIIGRHSRRSCAPYDQARLEKHLSALGYRIVVRKNQTAAEIYKIFGSIGRNSPEDPDLHIKKEDDSFICVISSRGKWDETRNTDVVLGCDGATIDLQQVVHSTLGATACELLKGKPKLFFIEAGRGDQYETVAGDSNEEDIPDRLPHESDFLFSYATAPMTKSYLFYPGPMALPPEGEPIDISQHEDYSKWQFGSFFTTELCHAFGRFGDRMDLMSMLLFVHQQLQATEKNVFKLSDRTTRQCPQVTLTLRGPVFFHDKALTLYKRNLKKCLE